MFVLMFAAIGGGLATVSVLSPLGIIPAALSAPIGGSLCALLAAVHISRRRGADWTAHAEFDVDLDARTDEMVSALRSVAAQAKEPVARHDSADTKAA